MKMLFVEDRGSDIAAIVNVLEDSGLIEVEVQESYAEFAASAGQELQAAIAEYDLFVLDILMESDVGALDDELSISSDFSQFLGQIGGRRPFIVFSRRDAMREMKSRSGRASSEEGARRVYRHGGIRYIRKSELRTRGLGEGSTAELENQVMEAIMGFYWTWRMGMEKC
jgi:CheY-like chemotaxis protein